MPGWLNGLFRTDPLLDFWFEVEVSVRVCAVYPLTKPLMPKSPKLGWVLRLQTSDDLLRFKWVTDLEADIYDLCPDRGEKPVHILMWDGWSVFLLCTGGTL